MLTVLMRSIIRDLGWIFLRRHRFWPQKDTQLVLFYARLRLNECNPSDRRRVLVCCGIFLPYLFLLDLITFLPRKLLRIEQ